MSVLAPNLAIAAKWMNIPKHDKNNVLENVEIINSIISCEISSQHHNITTSQLKG